MESMAFSGEITRKSEKDSAMIGGIQARIRWDQLIRLLATQADCQLGGLER